MNFEYNYLPAIKQFLVKEFADLQDGWLAYLYVYDARLPK